MQAPASVDLSQLQAELVAAGIDVLTGLCNQAGNIVCVASNGTTADLPPAAAAILAAHVPSTALHDTLVTALTSSVGVSIAALTQAQRLALIAGLLTKAGAIDKQTLAIKPLNQWLI